MHENAITILIAHRVIDRRFIVKKGRIWHFNIHISKLNINLFINITTVINNRIILLLNYSASTIDI